MKWSYIKKHCAWILTITVNECNSYQHYSFWKLRLCEKQNAQVQYINNKKKAKKRTFCDEANGETNG